MNLLLVTLGAAGLLGGFVWLDSRTQRSRLNAVYMDRRPLSDEEFVGLFPSGVASPETVINVRQILGAELDADLSRAVSTDSFETNLAFLLDRDSMADVAIIEALEREFKVSFSDAEAQAMNTILDIVQAIGIKQATAP